MKLLPLVERAVDLYLSIRSENEQGDGSALAELGMSPLENLRFEQFIPMAFAHAIFAPQGVQFSPKYILRDWDTGEQSLHSLSESAIYRAAKLCARRRLVTGATPETLHPVVSRSAEYSAIRKLGGGGLESIVLVEPILGKS